MKKWLYKIMYGRYGNDRLNTCLLWTYIAFTLAVMIMAVFSEHIHWGILLALRVLLWILAFVILFRMFSKDIQKRRRENERFLGFFKLLKNRIRDRKTHIYRRCPSCKVIIRLPKAKGKHTVVCPKCKNRFSVRG